MRGAAVGVLFGVGWAAYTNWPGFGMPGHAYWGFAGSILGSAAAVAIFGFLVVRLNLFNLAKTSR
jgi:hypothetical protein